VLELFERRGILSSETVAEMQRWGHSGGFSVHAGVRVAAPDRAGRERLLRYCARPMFSGERLVWAGGGAQVRYRLPWAALAGHRRGQQRSIELRLSTGEFLDRIAALMPPPRKHRHRYFGVLAPNSPWRALVTAQAGRKLTTGSKAPRPKLVREDAGATRPGHGARYMWAALLARIYGVFALKCSGLWCNSVGSQSGVWRIKWCSRIWRCGWRGGARIGVDQALVSCGEWCGLPNPDFRQCALATCDAY